MPTAFRSECGCFINTYNNEEGEIGGAEVASCSLHSKERVEMLEKAATQARDWFTWWVESTSANLPAGVLGSEDVLAALREALGKGEKP